MTDGRRQRGVSDETCCCTLAVTPMAHKGLTAWRYDCKSNYMVTLVTEPRASIFGVLREWGVERSVEGKAVYDAWQLVESRFPGVRATYNSIMPDHFHGIVYVAADGAADLNEIVSFFAGEVERRIGRRVWNSLWRDSICLARGQLHRQINYVLTNAKRRWIKEQNAGLFKKVMGFSHWRLDRANEALCEIVGADNWDFRRFAHDPAAECWDLETGVEIVKPRKANCIQRAFGEVPPIIGSDDRGERQQADNGKGGANGNKIVWTSLGNPFLLDEPMLVSVRISTKTPPKRLEEIEAKIVAKAERGAVIVGPWISPGEKAIRASVAAAGGKIVQLLPEGMDRYYKPIGADFALCAEGRLLQISPFTPSCAKVEREHYGKARFEWLNLAARAMGDLAMGVSRAELEGRETTSGRQQGGEGSASGRQQGGTEK